MERPPLALYVHVPWCVRKCPYCDFNSHGLTGELPAAAWLARIEAELDAESSAVDRPLVSVFVGGGTPSLLDAGTIAGLLDAISARFHLAGDAEITLEANPGTAEAERFAGYRAAGVNRLSLGVQSFDDAALARLGRIHGGAEARRAIDLAHGAGFERLNVDLMHGLPGQSVAAALEDLDRALAAGVRHLSWYQLTIEPNTAFHSRPPTLPVEDVLEDIEAEGAARLLDAGLARYEVSAWAEPGEESRHNLNYWSFGDYLGIGPGAHGTLTGADGTILRTRRTRGPKDWLETGNGPPARNAAPVGVDALPGEFMMNALRLIDGVEPALFEARTGRGLGTIREPLRALRDEGLLREDRLATTPLGLRFLDRVVGTFLD
jgi:oxygen-independent coproporphyrinogen-3 oxidase